MEVTSQEVQNLADEACTWRKRFAQNKKERGQHFLICGNSGTGKTHVSERLYRWCRSVAISLWDMSFWPKPPRVEMFEWSKVVFLNADEWKRWLDDRGDTGVLFLEDIGAEVDRFKTGEPTERLRELLNDFKHRWMFITTNVMPEKWSAKWDERVADRLLRDTQVFVIRGIDRYTLVEDASHASGSAYGTYGKRVCH